MDVDVEHETVVFKVTTGTLFRKCSIQYNWFFFFILKVANIRYFILIAVDIFNNIIHKYVERRKYVAVWFSCIQSIFIHSYIHTTYIVNSFGKAFAHVQNCLLKKKAHGTNKNIDGFYTKTTQKGGFSKLCVKLKKKVIPTYSIFQHVSII